jgi:hypothetical protein
MDSPMDDIDDDLYNVNNNPSEPEKNLLDDKNSPLGLIQSAEATVGDIIDQCKHEFKRLKRLERFNELPTEFIEVYDWLPRTKDALNHAMNYLNWGKESTEPVRLLAVRLESKVKKLENIFTQVADETSTQNGQTVLKCYITILRPLPNPKSHQVEVLMHGILKDLETLFSEKPLRPGCSQTFDLKDVIEKISNVKSSVQESDLTPTGQGRVQNIYDHGTGHQYNGENNTIYSGSIHTINNNNGTNPTSS